MTLGDIIAEYRKTNGLSMAKFAEMAGISKGYVSMLERNKTHRGEEPSPSVEVYRSVAGAIGVNIDDLVRMVDGKITLSRNLPFNIQPIPKTYKVPLVGNIACGKPILAVEDADEVVSVPEDIQADFALRCKGDSMINARIFDGDLVYIKQQPSVENGQIAAVRIGDEATLKKVYYSQDSARVTLRACNPLYPDMVYEGESLNDIDVLGLAVGFFSLVIHE